MFVFSETFLFFFLVFVGLVYDSCDDDDDDGDAVLWFTVFSRILFCTGKYVCMLKEIKTETTKNKQTHIQLYSGLQTHTHTHRRKQRMNLKNFI